VDGQDWARLTQLFATDAAGVQAQISAWMPDSAKTQPTETVPREVRPTTKGWFFGGLLNVVLSPNRVPLAARWGGRWLGPEYARPIVELADDVTWRESPVSWTRNAGLAIMSWLDRNLHVAQENRHLRPRRWSPGLSEPQTLVHQVITRPWDLSAPRAEQLMELLFDEDRPEFGWGEPRFRLWSEDGLPNLIARFGDAVELRAVAERLGQSVNVVVHVGLLGTGTTELVRNPHAVDLLMALGMRRPHAVSAFAQKLPDWWEG
jgi:hypothetical protein